MPGLPFAGGGPRRPPPVLDRDPPPAERDRGAPRPEPAPRRDSGDVEHAAVLEAFADHLSLERNLSRHTVRAYLGDVASLLDHAGRMGVDNVAAIDLRTLRSWLARLHTQGASRATLAPRASPARGFTARAHPRGGVPRRPRGAPVP